MKSMNISAVELKEADEIMWTKEYIGAMGVTGFNLYLKSGPKIKKVVGGPHWSEMKGYYHNTSVGMDRVLDTYLAIGYSLGLEFHEINQSKVRGY